MKKLALCLLVTLTANIANAQSTGLKNDTQCAVLPCVVESVSLVDQSSPINTTALVNPLTSGLYRVTYYLESSAIKGSVWGVSFNWTDDVKPHSSGNYVAYAGASSTYTFVMRAVAGQPITYAVTEGNGNPGGTTFDLFVTVEQLQ
jgi:hypothetical protein